MLEIQNKIEAVIFDLGRVLVDIDISRGIFGLFNHSSSDNSTKIAKIMAEPSVKLHNTGKISSEVFHINMTQYLELDLSYEEFCHKWCDIFTPVSEMAELTDKISQNYKIGLLSDTDPLHWNFVLDNFNYLKLFKNPALSFKIGTTKPDRTIYTRACELTGSLPENTLFIDDLEANVQGALDAGLQAFRHITPSQTIEKLKNYISSKPF